MINMLKSFLLSTMIMCVNALPVVVSYQDTITGSNDVNNSITYDNATNVVTFSELHLYNVYKFNQTLPEESLTLSSSLQIDTDFNLLYNLNTYTYKIQINSVDIYNPSFDAFSVSDEWYYMTNDMTLNRFERNYPSLDIDIFTINFRVGVGTCNYSYYIAQSNDSGDSVRSEGALTGTLIDYEHWPHYPNPYYITNSYDWFTANRNFFVSFRRQAIDFVTSYNSGYQIGYSDGYTDGNANDGTATEIFDGILSIGILPVNFFLSIFNFEVFGINIGGIVAALLSLTLVIILVKMVLGGRNG